MQTPFPNAGLLSAPAGSRRRVRENGSSTLGLALRLRRLANFDEESKGRESLLGEDCQVAQRNLDRARRRLARVRRLRDNGPEAPMTSSVEAPLAVPSGGEDPSSLPDCFGMDSGGITGKFRGDSAGGIQRSQIRKVLRGHAIRALSAARRRPTGSQRVGILIDRILVASRVPYWALPRRRVFANSGQADSQQRQTPWPEGSSAVDYRRFRRFVGRASAFPVFSLALSVSSGSFAGSRRSHSGRSRW